MRHGEVGNSAINRHILRSVFGEVAEWSKAALC